jgi:hypothetical protein
MIGFMFTSLKVVSMAVSFFTATNLLETVFLREDIFSLLTFLEPGIIGAGADSAAFGAGAEGCVAGVGF